jgi:uncharacterized membrane protein
LTVVGVLLGQVASVIWSVASIAQPYLPQQSPLGYALLFLSGVAIVILICFIAGILARRAMGRRFTALVEKYLLMLFPRYAIFKEQLSGNIGGKEFHNSLTPVLVEFIDHHRLGLEIERHSNGKVAIFLPGSPDPWSGTILVVADSKVSALATPIADALACHEQLGRGILGTLQPVGGPT